MQTLTRTARPATESAIESLRRCHDELVSKGAIVPQKFSGGAGIKAAYLTCLAVQDKCDRLLPDIATLLKEADELDALSLEKPWTNSRWKDDLAEQQRSAFDRVHEWFFSGGKRFLFQGGAGTGKTYSLSRIIQSLQEIQGRSALESCSEARFKVAIVAPTHEAVKVIRGFVQRSGLANVHISTIHSLLHLKPGKFRADGTREMMRDEGNMADRYENFSLVIIDESSMLGPDILKHIPKNTPTIYMGDWAQLPPVDPSEATDRKADPVLSLVFHTPDQLELTDVHRYEGAIAKTALSIRDSIRSGSRPTIYFEGNLSRMPAEKWTKHLIDSIKDGVDVRALLFTNAAVTALNHEVRSALFPDAGKYEIGDRLRAKGPIIKIATDDEIDAIIRLETTEKESSGKLSFDRDESREIYIRSCVQKALRRQNNSSEGNIMMQTCSGCVVKSVAEKTLWLAPLLGDGLQVRAYDLELHSDDDLLFTKTAVHCDDRAMVTKYLKSLAELIFREEPGRRSKAWRSYYNILGQLNLTGKGQGTKTAYIDLLQYGYAITTHQSQGSTIDLVMADFANIARCPSPKMRKMLQYTALTRAAKECIIKLD
ncbi:MAG: AAA family ATPase [Microcoleus sp.]